MDLPPDQRSAVAANRDAWNESAALHRASSAWQALIGSVGKPDFSCFDPTLTELLLRIGVRGKHAIQIGCNNGRECLSLLGLGAVHVVGVDQSPAFLDQARELSALSPHSPAFVEADVHSLPPELHARFDLALITIGVLNWMPDLGIFFAEVAKTLKHGGTAIIYETHPFLEMFVPEADDPFRPAESYFRINPIVEDRAIVYEGKAAAAGVRYCWYVHTLGSIVAALIGSGLQITHFKEYPHSNREEAYDIYRNQKAQLPMCYTLTANRYR